MQTLDTASCRSILLLVTRSWAAGPIRIPEIRRPCALSTMAGRVANRRALQARFVSAVRA